MGRVVKPKSSGARRCGYAVMRVRLSSETHLCNQLHNFGARITLTVVSLPHALLTSLLERPSSGYDLARRFDSSIGYYWRASHQQIYRELARMEDAGWISSDEVAEHARKRIHRCLPAGEAELRRWAATGDPIPAQRDPLLIRLRAEAAIGGLGLESQVAQRLAEHESRITAYRAIEARDFAGDLDRRGRVQYAILRAGIMTEESWIEWCQMALATLPDPTDADA